MCEGRRLGRRVRVTVIAAPHSSCHAGSTSVACGRVFRSFHPLFSVMKTRIRLIRYGYGTVRLSQDAWGIRYGTETLLKGSVRIRIPSRVLNGIVMSGLRSRWAGILRRQFRVKLCLHLFDRRNELGQLAIP